MVSLSSSMLLPASRPYGSSSSAGFSIWRVEKTNAFCSKERKYVCACMAPPRDIGKEEGSSVIKFSDSHESEQLAPKYEPEDDSDVLIECRNVHKSSGEKHILRGVNFKIRHGEAVGIIGPSGTGNQQY